MAIGGSGLETLARDMGDTGGGNWGADGTILYAPNNISGISASNANSAWDVAPDGRFLRIQEVEPEPRLAQIDVVLGFDREIEAALAGK